MRDKITKRAVEALQPSSRDVFLWDTELPGFGCKITPKASRVYILQYTRRGRDHRVTLGRHGIDVTPEQARLEARRLRELVAAGENPAAGPSRQIIDITITKLGERYLEEYAVPHKKEQSIAQDRRNLSNHVLPLIGKLMVSEVECADISRVLRDVASGKTERDEKTKRHGQRIVRGGQIAANRVHALMSKMFALAEDWKLRPEGSNPCRKVKRYVERKVERFLSVDELGRLGSAFDRWETELSGDQSNSGALRRFQATRAISALRLLLLTGCRRNEILRLRGRYIDAQRRLLMHPDSKTGAKTVYLSIAAYELLDKVKPLDPEEYVPHNAGHIFNPGQFSLKIPGQISVEINRQ